MWHTCRPLTVYRVNPAVVFVEKQSVRRKSGVNLDCSGIGTFLHKLSVSFRRRAMYVIMHCMNGTAWNAWRQVAVHNKLPASGRGISYSGLFPPDAADNGK